MVEFDYDNNEPVNPAIKISGLPREIYEMIREKLLDLQRGFPGVYICNDPSPEDPMDVFIVKPDYLSQDSEARLNGLVNMIEQEIETILAGDAEDTHDEGEGHGFHHTETTGSRTRIPLLKIAFDYQSRDPERRFIVELLDKFRDFCATKSQNRLIPKLGKTGGTVQVPARMLYVYVTQDDKIGKSKQLGAAHKLMTAFVKAYGDVNHNGFSFEFVPPENNRGPFVLKIKRFEE